MGDFAGKSAEHFARRAGQLGLLQLRPPRPAPCGGDACSACHEVNAADDFVFTQFYPVLRAAKPSP